MRRVPIAGIILVVCISYASLEKYTSIDHHSNMSMKNSTNETNCTSVGFMCKNCREVVYCETSDNGSLIERPMGECYDSNDTCLDGFCTADYNPACSPPPEEKVDFICRTPGLYPDPYECTTFHYCARSKYSNRTLIKLTDTCDCDYAYNAGSSFCDLPLYNGTCYGYPAPVCTSKGQTAAWFANPRLYYICAPHPSGVLYPFMYACEHGKIYDENEYLCKEM